MNCPQLCYLNFAFINFQSGYIEAPELRKAFEMRGLEVNEQELKAMIEDADAASGGTGTSKGDGRVSLEEFKLLANAQLSSKLKSGKLWEKIRDSTRKKVHSHLH